MKKLLKKIVGGIPWRKKTPAELPVEAETSPARITEKDPTIQESDNTGATGDAAKRSLEVADQEPGHRRFHSLRKASTAISGIGGKLRAAGGSARNFATSVSPMGFLEKWWKYGLAGIFAFLLVLYLIISQPKYGLPLLAIIGAVSAFVKFPQYRKYIIGVVCWLLFLGVWFYLVSGFSAVLLLLLSIAVCAAWYLRFIPKAISFAGGLMAIAIIAYPVAAPHIFMQVVDLPHGTFGYQEKATEFRVTWDRAGKQNPALGKVLDVEISIGRMISDEEIRDIKYAKYNGLDIRMYYWSFFHHKIPGTYHRILRTEIVSGHCQQEGGGTYSISRTFQENPEGIDDLIDTEITCL